MLHRGGDLPTNTKLASLERRHLHLETPALRLAASIHVKRKELDRDEEKKVRVPLKGPHFFGSQAGAMESSVTNVLPRRSTVYRHFFICVKF